MQKQNLYRFAIAFTAIVVFQLAAFSSINAQTAQTNPDLSVIGIDLGNREKAREFLSQGFSPRKSEDGRPAYYFYNEWGSQVMKLTAASFDDPYFINEIEVFAVGRDYRERHYQAEKIKFFETDGNVFIGFKQSAMYFIAAVKNVGSKRNTIEPKDIVELKGEPSERAKIDGKREVLTYNIANVKLPADNSEVNYQASYEFYKKDLKRFKLKIKPAIDRNPIGTAGF